MATHFFSRYKNYSIQVTVNDEVKTVNFTPWGEFGHVHIDDSDLEDALTLHSKVIAYGDSGNSWVAPPGKDIVYGEMDGIPLPPSSEVGNVAQPFGLTSENFPHYLNNLEKDYGGSLLSIDGMKLKLSPRNIYFLPIVEGNPAEIGELYNVPIEGNVWSLIVGKRNDSFDCIAFGEANAKVVDSPDIGSLLYGLALESSYSWVLTPTKTESTTQYPLAIYLGEPIDENSLTKVFFFGGVSYPIYVMVSELIQSALNP